MKTSELGGLWCLLTIHFLTNSKVSASYSHNKIPPIVTGQNPLISWPTILNGSSSSSDLTGRGGHKNVELEWGATGQFLACHFHPGSEAVTVRWIFNGKDILACESKFIMTDESDEELLKNVKNAVLTFTKITTKFIGNYTCHVESENGMDSLEFLVDVRIPWGKVLGVSFAVGSFCLLILICIIILFIKRTSVL